MAEERRAERILQLTADEGMIGDISETGLCLKLNALLNATVGSLQKVELSSKEQKVTLEAKVVYVRKMPDNSYQAGFEFTRLTQSNRQSIFDMVDSYSRGVPIKAKLV